MVRADLRDLSAAGAGGFGAFMLPTWERSVPEPIPRVWGYGINNAGVVVGDFVYPRHAFRDSGLMFDLGTLGGATSIAYGINNLAQGVGVADTQTTSHAVLWTAIGMSDLGTLGGATSIAFGINNNGLITGLADTPSNIPMHSCIAAE